MNIFLRELKANFKSLIIWGVIVLFFVTVSFSKFSAFAENPEMLAILDTMPPAMLEAFNMNAFNLTTITGFFGVMYAYFGLLLAVAGVMWGSDIITKEERDKTVEFSLTLPVTRARVITAKALAAAVNCVALLLITWAATMFASQSYEPDSAYYQFAALAMLALLIVQFVFLAVGIFLGCAMKRYKQATSAAVSVLLTAFFLYIISGLHDSLDFLKYISPFKFFDPLVLLHDSRLEPVSVVIAVLIIAACMAGAYLSYQKRDLYI